MNIMENNEIKVFDEFTEWQSIEQNVCNFIRLVDYDGNSHHLPSNHTYNIAKMLDSDECVIIDDVYISDKPDMLMIDEGFCGHTINRSDELSGYESNLSLKNEKLTFIMDQDSLAEYVNVEPSIQRMVNKQKLLNLPLPNFHVDLCLLDEKVVDISGYELLRQYRNLTFINKNYIVIDESLLEKLNHMVIDNKALMLVVNIMYRGLLSHNH